MNVNTHAVRVQLSPQHCNFKAKLQLKQLQISRNLESDNEFDEKSPGNSIHSIEQINMPLSNQTPSMLKSLNSQRQALNFTQFICPAILTDLTLAQIETLFAQQLYFYEDSNKNNLFHLLFQKFNEDKKLAYQLTNILLTNKVNPNALNKENLSPVHLAVKLNQISAVKFAHKYNQKQKKEVFDFNQTVGLNKNSLVHIAAQKGFVKIIHYLEAEGVSFFEENTDGCTPKRVALQTSLNYKILKQCELNQIKKLLQRDRMKINSENISEDEIKIAIEINNKQLIYHKNSKNIEISRQIKQQDDDYEDEQIPFESSKVSSSNLETSQILMASLIPPIKKIPQKNQIKTIDLRSAQIWKHDWQDIICSVSFINSVLQQLKNQQKQRNYFQVIQITDDNIIQEIYQLYFLTVAMIEKISFQNQKLSLSYESLQHLIFHSGINRNEVMKIPTSLFDPNDYLEQFSQQIQERKIKIKKELIYLAKSIAFKIQSVPSILKKLPSDSQMILQQRQHTSASLQFNISNQLVGFQKIFNQFSNYLLQYISQEQIGRHFDQQSENLKFQNNNRLILLQYEELQQKSERQIKHKAKKYQEQLNHQINQKMDSFPSIAEENNDSRKIIVQLPKQKQK